MGWLTNLVSDWTMVLIMVSILGLVFGLVEVSNWNERRKWRRLAETITRAGTARHNGHGHN
jgi:hypothetical protein